MLSWSRMALAWGSMRARQPASVDAQDLDSGRSRDRGRPSIPGDLSQGMETDGEMALDGRGWAQSGG